MNPTKRENALVPYFFAATRGHSGHSQYPCGFAGRSGAATQRPHSGHSGHKLRKTGSFDATPSHRLIPEGENRDTLTRRQWRPFQGCETGNAMQDCNAFWAYADHLPIDQVIQYWCERSGHNAQHCRDAKRAAIVAECERGNIQYRRSDGKTFTDPASDLAARGVLLIEKASFDAWYSENFEGVSPLPEPPLNRRKETTYLNIIGGLLGLMLGTTPGGQKGSAYESQAAIISAMLAHHGGKPGIADSTLEQKFSEANRSIKAS